MHGCDQTVPITGRVVSTDSLVLRTDCETDTGIESIRIELTDIGTSVDRDDRLQVFGVLTAPRTVRATNVVVVPQSGLWYAWITSFVAGLWVLARILRHWTLDIETGAFLAYAILRALSWRYDWLRTPYVTAGMAGAFMPDIVKIRLLLPSATVEAALGIPFSWAPIHRLGGTAICILIMTSVAFYRSDCPQSGGRYGNCLH